MSQQRSNFSKAIANFKSKISGKLISRSISDVTIALVNYEKTRLKKMIMIIIISVNKSQESMVFGGRQKMTSTMKQRSEK